MPTKYGFGTAADPLNALQEWQQEGEQAQITNIEEWVSELDAFIQELLTELVDANGWPNAVITKAEVVWIVEHENNKLIELTLDLLPIANSFLFDIYCPAVQGDSLAGRNIVKLQAILQQKGGLFAQSRT